MGDLEMIGRVAMAAWLQTGQLHDPMPSGAQPLGNGWIDDHAQRSIGHA
jgi:hypothetical protein